jgi:hypothetical protein
MSAVCGSCGGGGLDYSYGTIDVPCALCAGTGEIDPPGLMDDQAEAMAESAFWDHAYAVEGAR